MAKLTKIERAQVLEAVEKVLENEFGTRYCCDTLHVVGSGALANRFREFFMVYTNDPFIDLGYLNEHSQNGRAMALLWFWHLEGEL